MSTESHGLQFVVDTSGVQKGFRDYKAAVEGVFDSLDKFEAHVAKTMKSVANVSTNGAALSSFKNAVAGFSGVKVDSGTVNSITALANAMRNFRAPSTSESANLKTFTAALRGGLPDLTAAYRSIKSIGDLNTAMRGFKAPPTAQAQAFVAFAQAMQKAMPLLVGLGSASSSAKNIAALGTAFAGFRAPPVAQAESMVTFATAMSKAVPILKEIGSANSSAKTIATLGASLVNFKSPSAAQAEALVAFATAMEKAVPILKEIGSANAAAKTIETLGVGLAGFKAPSTTQAEALVAFATAMSKAVPILKEVGAVSGAAKAIDTLNVGMAGFKVPSSTQIENLTLFAKALQSAAPAFKAFGATSGLSSSVSQLSSLGSALSQIKPPSSAQVTNLGNLALALRSFNFSNLSNSASLFATIAAIGQFKAPTSTQTKNLVEFANAISGIKVPANGAAIAAYLQQISTAAASANGAVVKFGNSVKNSSSGFPGFSAGAHGARLEMMGLQNAFSGTFQVGSVLRSLLGSLTLGELGRSFFQATQMANQFKASMEVVSSLPGMSSLAWDRVAASANHFGADLSTYAESFAKFAAAAHESGMGVNETFKVFEGFQTAMTGLHLGTEQQQSVGLAIREIMDRGYVSTQQLTRQLGLVMPGALSTLKKAWEEQGTKGISIFDALKKKMVDGQWALDVLASHYKETYGPALAQALQSPIQQFNILKNNITQMMVQAGNAGAMRAFADLIHQVSTYLSPDKMKQFSDTIGKGLASAAQTAGRALAYLHDNWDSIKGPLTTVLGLMGKWMAISAAFKIGSTILSPITQLRSVMTGLTGPTNSATGQLSSLGKVMQTLKAGTMPLNSGLAGLGPLGVRLAGSFSVLNSTSKGTSLAMTGLNAAANVARGGMNVLRAGATGLLNVFGGPFGLAIIAAGAAVAALATKWMGFSQALGSTDALIKDSTKTLYDLGITTNAAAQATLHIGAEHAAAVDPMYKFAGATGEAARQLWNLAMAQKVALQQQIATESHKVVEQYHALDGISTDGRAKMQGRLFAPGESLGEAMGNLGSLMAGGAKTTFDSLYYGKDDRSDADRQRKSLQTYQAKLEAEARAVNARTPESLVTDAMRQMSTPGGPFKPQYAGTEDKDKDKTKKDKDLAAMKQFEDGIDALVGKLESSDPIAKIVNDWSKTLDKGAELLLDKGAMKVVFEAKETFAGVGGATETTHAKVDALIKQLQSGNLTAAAQKYLKTSGRSVDDLVTDLREGEKAEDDKIVAAYEAAYQKKFKSQTTAMQKMAEYDPVAKVGLDTSSALAGDASQFLNSAAYQRYESVLSDVRNGTISAGDATQQFANALANGGAKADASTADTQMLIKAILQYGHAQDAATKAAKESLDIGEKLLRQKREERALIGQSDRDASILTDLQAAVKEQHDSMRGDYTSAQIAKLKEQLGVEYDLTRAQKERADWFKNNGVKAYINGTDQIGTAINNLDKNFLQSFEDQLVSLGKTGKFSFSTIFETIQDGLLKFSAQQITKSIFGGLTGADSKDNPTIFGKIFPGSQKAPTPITNQDHSQTALTVTPEGKIAIDSTAKSFATTMQAQNGDIAGKFQTSLTATFQPIGQALQTTLASAITAAGGKGVMPILGASAAVPVAGALPASGSVVANDNNLIEQFSKIDIVDKTKLPTIASLNTSTDPITDKLVSTQTDKVAEKFGTSMTAMMPILGLSFASAFKSPIAQIAATFGTMILSQLAGKSGGGIGGILSKIAGIGMSIFGGGGSADSVDLGGADLGITTHSVSELDSSLPGFKEGGIVGSPVTTYKVAPSAFTNAPHYSEGTPNTSGGHPAILHDNEAVIPLSRNRKVAVELSGGAAAGASSPTINMPNVHVNVHNYGDGKANVQQSQNPDGSMNLDVIVERIETHLAGNVNKGGSPLNTAIEKRYNVSSAAGNYR